MCVAFGMRHRTQIFQHVSDAMRHIMLQCGFNVVNYVDDFIGNATPSIAQASYQFLVELLSKLGLEISVKKLVPPSHRAICLGVEIDTHERTVSIPAEKLERICELVEQWSTKKICTKRQLQSLLGNLLYMHKCVHPARIFLIHMLDLLRQNYDSKNITITVKFKRDLRWLKKFLKNYNGISFDDHVRSRDILELDACLTGLGDRCENLVYHMSLPQHCKNLGIVQLEMINILVAIRIFSKIWSKKHVLVKCDN